MKASRGLCVICGLCFHVKLAVLNVIDTEARADGDWACTAAAIGPVSPASQVTVLLLSGQRAAQSRNEGRQALRPAAGMSVSPEEVGLKRRKRKEAAGWPGSDRIGAGRHEEGRGR